MHKFTTLLNFLLLCLSFNCCKQNKTEIIEFELERNSEITTFFKINEKQLKHITLKSENIQGLFTEIAIKDSFLICGNLRSQKLVNLYSLKSKKRLNQILIRGTESNQGLSVAGLSKESISSPNIWVYDITLKKLINVDIFKAIKDTNYIAEYEFNLTDKLKNVIAPQILNDGSFLATTYTLDDNRYFYSDFKKITKKIGKLPKVENGKKMENMPNAFFPNAASIFKAIAIKNPIQNTVAVFYNKTDRVEFYTNDKLSKIVNCVESFGPKMEVTKLERGYALQDNEKTRYAYLSITYTKDYIYCLYSGSKNNEACSNKILVFNWNGNFINELVLDKKVCKIAIDDKGKILYCYAEEDNKIYSTTL